MFFEKKVISNMFHLFYYGKFDFFIVSNSFIKAQIFRLWLYIMQGALILEQSTNFVWDGTLKTWNRSIKYQKRNLRLFKFFFIGVNYNVRNLFVLFYERWDIREHHLKWSLIALGALCRTTGVYCIHQKNFVYEQFTKGSYYKALLHLHSLYTVLSIISYGFVLFSIFCVQIKLKLSYCENIKTSGNYC